MVYIVGCVLSCNLHSEPPCNDNNIVYLNYNSNNNNIVIVIIIIIIKIVVIIIVIREE